MNATPLPTPESPAQAAMALTVVGIGASAGGLKALQQFVHAIPEDSGMAYVVIVHLDPARKSRMRELLQDRSAIPVTQVDEPTTLEANQIYIIPPDRDLAVERTTLELRPRGERAEHAPVDLFLRTLADAYGPNAVGIVLSGTGADGTAGVRHIREAGGITIAQLPEESEYEGMPASAITTGLIDLVLPAAQMPGELLRLRRRPAPLGSGAGAAADLEAGLAHVFATLRSRTGHDFSQYKRSTVLRRLDRRLRFNNVTTLEEYQPLIESSSTESNALLRDLLISVSSFFRDPEAFEALAVLTPQLFAGKDAADAVRVWVVGCATGEEVYSIAMVLSEHAGTLSDPPRIQLFATDIDEHGYAWARAGLYSQAAVAGVTASRLQRFFTKEVGGYRIAKSLREQVLFAGHNVLHDPPFSRMDLISCRNFFIYLQPEAQERVLETFHFATNPDGVLFLGASESVGDSGLFASIGAQRLFRRTVLPYRAPQRLSAADPLPGTGPGVLTIGGDVASLPPRRFSYGAQHVRMLEQYAPASVIVDERLDVVHMSAGASRFLQLGEGEPSHSLLGLARGDLRRVLRTTLHHSFEEDAPVSRSVVMNVDGDRRHVNVHVRPSRQGESAGRFALIMFEIESAGIASPESADPAHPGADAVQQEELRRTRDLLESMSAAHDSTMAELQTVNEELQSINEEQRAAGEELETSREEIQSINEELTTINQEHQSTIEELKRTNADLQNLIESTEIGTIFIDRSMRVRRFTPAVSPLFNFVQADQGRPLAHITHHLQYPGLLSDVAHVLESLERIEREITSDTGESFIVRVNPYRSHDGANEGAVITFYDNTPQQRIRQELMEARRSADGANLAKGTFLATMSHEFRTPLNAILGYADLLSLDGPLNEAQERKIERIKAGGWHLAAMIGEILSFAKLDGGHEIVEPESTDARGIAREAGALVEPAAAAKGLDFVIDVPDKPIAMMTDAGKVRQILINLCGNAIKYTEAGQVALGVRREDRCVHFDISDTGIGIAPEHVARIFDRFWQVDGGSTRVTDGLGIGLAAAREYARLLRGDVEVLSSEQGRGTTFRLRLPVDYDRR
jgi:two-component system, chemotaxis family, CheB/CheR fusion protein